MNPWKHIRAVLLLPLMVTVVVPAVLIYARGPDTGGLWERFPPSRVALPVIGAILIGLGLVLVVSTNWLFAKVGQGTLAPWDPPQRLVVRGVYRHVRNPMISGVLLTLLGEASAFASLPLLAWFAFFAAGNLIYIPLVEEPRLLERFGKDYAAYKKNVPRWIPRIRAWNSSD